MPLRSPRLLTALANGSISRWWALLIIPAWLVMFVVAAPFVLAVLLWQSFQRRQTV